MSHKLQIALKVNDSNSDSSIAFDIENVASSRSTNMDDNGNDSIEATLLRIEHGEVINSIWVSHRKVVTNEYYYWLSRDIGDQGHGGLLYAGGEEEFKEDTRCVGMMHTQAHIRQEQAQQQDNESAFATSILDGEVVTSDEEGHSMEVYSQIHQ